MLGHSRQDSPETDDKGNSKGPAETEVLKETLEAGTDKNDGGTIAARRKAALTAEFEERASRNRVDLEAIIRARLSSPWV